MGLTGVVLIFLAMPLLLFPLFEEAISTTPPTDLEEELTDHVVINTQIEVVRTPASRLAGHRLEEARIRSRTGCTLVGVECDGDVITDLGPEFRIEANDRLIVAGTGEGTNRFTELLE